jgi:hypothetical protein
MKRPTRRLSALPLLLGLSTTSLAADAPAPDVRQFGVPALSRRDFNRLALHADSALFWQNDDNGNALLDPEELTLVGLGHPPRTNYVRSGRFTRRFERAYRGLVELRRREAVRRELNAGRPTLVSTDLRNSAPAEKQLVRLLLRAARLIDQLYYRQTGAAEHRRRIARADPASRALFRRNSGPWCTAPQTRDDRFCNALANFPRRRSENYPTDMAQDESLCRLLEQQPNADALFAPFTVVRKRGTGFASIPYNQAFSREMKAVATLLDTAARHVDESGPEQLLHRYLTASARAFRTNDWETADRAWAAMSSGNSRWYLRIGPDEVYQDLCQRKAAFHLALARLDAHSLRWKRLLMPLRKDMEDAVAKLIGSPYRARPIAFEMPDFIRIVLNAGDSRHPLGATIGQSLPNWGSVAREGRGRTVVMTNLYTDTDSRTVARRQAERLLSKGTFAHFTDLSDPSVLVTILHEASHNFGPQNDKPVRGKSAAQIFGGRLAAMLEELKAQSMALWFLRLLHRRGLLSMDQVRQAHTSALMWSFGHISRGLQTDGGMARPYSMLAAVQLGHLRTHGVLKIEQGHFALRFEGLARAFGELTRTVGQIKARGDAAAAKDLIERYTNDAALQALGVDRIRRQMLRYPKASFRYAIRL